MKKKREGWSLRTQLLFLAVLLILLPITGFGIYVLAAPETYDGAWGLSLFLLCIAGMATYSFLLYLVLHRRIYAPLQYFRETLEDISEGFILDRVPEEHFHRAEPKITEAFRQVIHMNRRMLKNVDSLAQGFEEERQAKLAGQALTRSYQRFVPKDFISFLQKSNITEVELGDHVQTEMTILVSDIRSFTSLSEKMTPEDNFKLINSYLYEMEPIVNEHHGFIDKYMGDSIMALFHRNPDLGVKAAVSMLDQLEQFNRKRITSALQPLQIGIGLNTGSMMLGIVGGENRMEGTVISDAVNLVSRIEELNKSYGTSLLMSEFTYAKLDDPSQFLIRLIDRVQVKGKTKAVAIYEVFDADPEPLKLAKQKSAADFEIGIQGYLKQDYLGALDAFKRYTLQVPDDLVGGIYLKRCTGKLAGLASIQANEIEETNKAGELE